VGGGASCTTKKKQGWGKLKWPEGNAKHRTRKELYNDSVRGRRGGEGRTQETFQFFQRVRGREEKGGPWKKKGWGGDGGGAPESGENVFLGFRRTKGSKKEKGKKLQLLKKGCLPPSFGDL